MLLARILVFHAVVYCKASVKEIGFGQGLLTRLVEEELPVSFKESLMFFWVILGINQLGSDQKPHLHDTLQAIITLIINKVC